MRLMTAFLFLAGLTVVSAMGCNEKARTTSTEAVEIETPNGTTTVTTEKEVKTSGENPPAVKP